VSDSGIKFEVHSRAESDTLRIAAALALQLRAGDVVTLSGELGAGKTCFVRGLGEGMGIPPSQVSSPTFVIRHEYDAPSVNTTSEPVRLVHIDAYRLKGEDDLESIGWEELLSDGNCVVAIEWPERIQRHLPAHRIDIALRSTGASNRLIQVGLVGLNPARAQSIEHALAAWELLDAQDARLARVCPSCGKPVAVASPSVPFCSPRCKMADLGKWFSGQHVISRPLRQEDASE
jgi:tRNA threonylcarbamoyl adenosine modification protein YjeE